MLRKILLILSLIFTIANIAHAEHAITKHKYVGYFTYPGDELELTATHVFSISDGKISGNYTFMWEGEEEDEVKEGKLIDINLNGLHLTAKWQDEFGSGNYTILFDKQFKSFKGVWSQPDENKTPAKVNGFQVTDKLINKIISIAKLDLTPANLCYIKPYINENYPEYSEEIENKALSLANGLLKENNIVKDTYIYYSILDAGWMLAFIQLEADNDFKLLENKFQTYKEISNKKLSEECKKLHKEAIKNLWSFK